MCINYVITWIKAIKSGEIIATTRWREVIARTWSPHNSTDMSQFQNDLHGACVSLQVSRDWPDMRLMRGLIAFLIPRSGWVSGWAVCQWAVGPRPVSIMDHHGAEQAPAWPGKSGMHKPISNICINAKLCINLVSLVLSQRALFVSGPSYSRHSLGCDLLPGPG